MNFGQAIDALKEGKKVGRHGWNGKGMWLILVPGSAGPIQLTPNTPYHRALSAPAFDQCWVEINQHIDMYTATGEMQPGWLASQTDMLADDWEVVS